jgi:hypothetical protein
MQDLASIIVRELAEASSWLLQAGAAQSAPSAPAETTSSRSWHAVIEQIVELRGILDALLEEATHENLDRSPLLVARRTPKRAHASRAPRDFAQMPGIGLRPLVWLAGESIGEPDPQALAWLAHVLGLLEDEFRRASRSVREHLAQVLAEHVESAGALRQDHQEQRESQRLALQALEGEFLDAEARLGECHAILQAAADWRCVPSARKPWPFPQSSRWRRAAILAEALEDPRSELPRRLERLFARAPSHADLPFLYQRWCGLKLVRAIEKLGLVPQQDLVPVLFLGGRLDFAPRSAPHTPLITLWVEPRIPPRQDPDAPHESGLSTTDKGEASPDYLLLRHGTRRPLAYVLDPSFTLAPSLEKGRYRTRLAFHAPTLIAGTPSFLPPARAFAAQPLARPDCLLHDAEGRTGVVPMNPRQYAEQAVRSWLAELADGD